MSCPSKHSRVQGVILEVDNSLRTMASHGGAADSYYKGSEMQPQAQYPPQGYNNASGYQGGQGAGYQQSPPNYGQDYQNPGGPSADGKQTFDQAFKLDRPKYNDLWAGILVGSSSRVTSVLTNCPVL